MSYGPGLSTQSALGPLGASPTITSTAPLTGNGVLNNTIGTTVTKVLSARSGTASGPAVRRVKLVNLSASASLAFQIVPKDATAPTHTATGGGTATDGILVTAGKIEPFTLAATFDLYLVASAASTPYQLVVIE